MKPSTDDWMPFKFMAFSTLLTVSVLGWLGWSTWTTYGEIREMQAVSANIDKLQGSVVRFQGTTAMAARMAAMTGDPVWERRFREADLRHDHAFDELALLSPGADAEQFKAQMARTDKVVEGIEERIFTLVKQGRRSEARAFLTTSGYEHALAAYGEFADKLMDRIDRDQASAFEVSRKSLQWDLAGAIASVVLLIAAWALVARVTSRRHRVQREQAERIAVQADELAQLNASLDEKVRSRTAQLDASRRAALNMMQDSEKARLAAVKVAEALKLSQAQLGQGQKMESIGRLAGGVAHDFNNLLTAIGGYSGFLLQSLDAGDPRRDDVLEIQKAGDRAAALTRQLLAFSRQQRMEPKVLEINDVVANIEKMLRRIIGEHMELVFVPGKDLGLVKADAGQLEQVITNLSVNARDAMPQGGRITIETANVELEPDYVLSHPDAKPGPHVMISVSDSGSGMDSAVLSHLFEPFFTTKEQGKGTGLGLATSYGIIQQSGGTINVYSEVGHGTTFKIYLPRVQAPATQVSNDPKSAGLGRGDETILLAEDEETVRRFVERILRSSGYNVLTAKDPGEALKIAEKHDGPIHLLLTDVVMPRMHGTKLAELLSAARPEMKVVFMSGYTPEAVNQHSLLLPGAPFIQKPMTIEALTRKIRETLASVPLAPVEAS